MSEWQPIETAPKDGTPILLWWPAYMYEFYDSDQTEPPAEPSMAIGGWKRNPRIDGRSVLEQKGMRGEYFSDNCELDDYGLSLAKYAPSHWMPLPSPPNTDGEEK